MTNQTQELAHWRGSLNTADAVREEIARRWGEEEAANYHPLTNCFTFKTWLTKGYHVKKGEKATSSNVNEILTGTLTETATTISEPPKTAKDTNRPEKPQEGHPRTPTNKPDRIPPSKSMIHLLSSTQILM